MCATLEWHQLGREGGVSWDEGRGQLWQEGGVTWDMGRSQLGQLSPTPLLPCSLPSQQPWLAEARESQTMAAAT